jgi:hypothetical protein
MNEERFRSVLATSNQFTEYSRCHGNLGFDLEGAWVSLSLLRKKNVLESMQSTL